MADEMDVGRAFNRLAETGRHLQMHEETIGYVHRLIEQNREMIGLEANWSIQVEVKCAGEIPNHEALMIWDPEFFYARMQVRCGFAEEMTRWLVLHELCELQTWRTVEQWQKAVNALFPPMRTRTPLLIHQRATMHREWEVARNQEIECRLYGLLGEHRPGHLADEESGGMEDDDDDE
jgi:hypothetical protein